MAEYIAREVLLAQLRAMESYNASPMYRRGYDDCVATVLNAPTADVVSVVRCKDCKYAYTNSFSTATKVVLCSVNVKMMQEDDFCSCGERNDGGADND